MKLVRSLTPARSRTREREQEPLSCSASDPLSSQRDRVGARVPPALRARALRQNQTDAETLLWSKLRARQISGRKFRRQHSIGPYFADFACLETKLVIELDGGQHTEDAGLRLDEKRSSDMHHLGFQTLRFWNNDVLSQTGAVLDEILRVVGTLTPTLSRKQARKQEPMKANTP